jgi:hypothetical protein
MFLCFYILCFLFFFDFLIFYVGCFLIFVLWFCCFWRFYDFWSFFLFFFTGGPESRENGGPRVRFFFDLLYLKKGGSSPPVRKKRRPARITSKGDAACIPLEAQQKQISAP